MVERLIALLIAFAVTHAQAEPVGVSYLALQHRDFPCNRALSVFKGQRTPRISFLWGTFGKEPACLNKLLKYYPRAVIEVHLSNEVCRRKRNCYEGELFRNLSVSEYNRRLERRPKILRRRIRARVVAISTALTSDMGQHKFLLSAGLEDNFSDSAYRNLVDIITRVWDYEIVRNSVQGGSVYRADHVELHNDQRADTKGKRCIWSNDGLDPDFGQPGGFRNRISLSSLRGRIRRARNGGCKILVWWAAAQGLGYDSVVSARPIHRRIGISAKNVIVVRKLLREFNHE